jgi:hypothetical protein
MIVSLFDVTSSSNMLIKAIDLNEITNANKTVFLFIFRVRKQALAA